MNNIDRALIGCLCGEEPDKNESIADILAAAQSQAVLGIASQAILNSMGDKLPLITKLKIISNSLQVENRSKKMNHATVALVQLLEDNDIHYVVLKGQVVAARYSTPLMRQSGDIDFYVAKKDFEKAAKVIEDNWHVSVSRIEDDHHWSFFYKDVSFEMHYRCELFGVKKHQKYFDDLIEHDVLNERHYVNIDGCLVHVLGPETEIAYVFKHFFNHLMVEGIGLRQVLDLKVMLENNQYYDLSKLEQTLADIGYLKAFKVFVTLLADYLRFNTIRYSAKYSSDAKRMLEEILTCGNFGRKAYKNDTSSLKKSTETALRAFKHVITFGKLAPAETLGLIPMRVRISIRKYL